MEGTLLASGLGFPEGPVVMPDGSIVLCDGNTGQLLRWADGAHERLRRHGRLALGRDPRHRRRDLRHAGRQRPGRGRPELRPRASSASTPTAGRAAHDEHRGHHARRPERPRVRPRRPALVHRLRAPSRTTATTRARPASSSCSTRRATASMVLERPNVYPNGIAFDAQGRLYWTESMAQRVCRLDDGEPTVFCQLPDDARPRRHGVRRGRPALRLHHDLGRPDRALARGRGARGDHDRQQRDQLHLRRPDAVRDRDARSTTSTPSERTGTFWRVETDATGRCR